MMFDETVSEAALFEAILASERLPLYDPKIHLSAETAAKEWHVHPKTAIEMLERKAAEYGLRMIEVRNPETGKRLRVLAK